MRKYIVFIVIMAISIIAIFSCRKSVEPEANPSQMISSSIETELKIQSFINRLNSDLKDEKTYSIDSAIWYSTAFLNYTYAIYDSSLIYLSRDTSTFTLHLDVNNKVLESDLETAIEQMTDSLQAIFDELPANTKHVVSCMVYEVYVTQGRLDVGMISVIGWGFSSVYYDSFGITDYWKSMWNQGKCNGYSGDGDATIQLEYKLMHPLVQSDPSWRIYTIPEEAYVTAYIFSEDYPYTPSPRGFRGFHHTGSGNWDGPQCIPPSELNFYIGSNGIPYIINELKPQGLDFTEINVEGEVFFLDPEGFEEFHYFIITYAPKYKTTVPASSL